ncbi:MAG: restriction endonuclease subunit S, partial [Prevotella sp.]|nr:restriction endonuclease subunit S [Prevotella sp.]
PIDFIDGDRGINYPTKNEFHDNGYCLFLNTSNIRKGSFDFSQLDFISEEKNNLLRKGKIDFEDIILTTRGTVGNVAYYTSKVKYSRVRINSGMVIIRCLSKNIHPYFLYLYFRCPLFRKQSEKSQSGSAQPQLPISTLRRFLIPNYSLYIQQKIASVISSLDDKIELNNRINAELESMAKTLYDYWFVQFDFPDANGKPYKSSGGKMVYNEELKREIPEGWEVKELGRKFETLLGGTPSTEKKAFWDNGNINWLNSGEIANFPVVESELKITNEGLQKSATNLLPKGSVLISITRHLRVTILAIDACINQSVVGIKPKIDIQSNYLYPYLKNEIPRLMGLRTGAQQPHINKETVDKSLIVLPEERILKIYNEKSESFYKMIINNAKENQHLTSLRDWLLPMLMNGQVAFKIIDNER